MDWKWSLSNSYVCYMLRFIVLSLACKCESFRCPPNLNIVQDSCLIKIYACGSGTVLSWCTHVFDRLNCWRPPGTKRACQYPWQPSIFLVSVVESRKQQDICVKIWREVICSNNFFVSWWVRQPYFSPTIKVYVFLRMWLAASLPLVRMRVSQRFETRSHSLQISCFESN